MTDVLTFDPVSPESVFKRFREFYHPDARFYAVSKRDVEFAILGLKKVGKDTCELSYCVYPDYKGNFNTKEAVLSVLNFAFSVNYNKVMISTSDKPVRTLLHAFKRFGLDYMFTQGGKDWFLWEIKR